MIGLMSGTSMDGIDCSLVRIENSGFETKIDLLCFLTIPFPESVKERLLKMSQAEKWSVDEICKANYAVSELYSDSIFRVCQASKIDIKQIDLIGSHGQTIRHLPTPQDYFDKNVRSTLQIGEPAVIASRTRVVTVSNFRAADMAVGGEGAPLVPYFDYLMFNSKKENCVILNIGGIANITVIPKCSSIDEIVAFDTGPGNMVINALMQKLFDKDFDDAGKHAANGSISKDLLQLLLDHPYFQKGLPKSSGREEFGQTFVDEILKINEELNLKSNDLIATVTELTAASIAKGVALTRLRLRDVDQLIVSGGGVHNKTLMQQLKRKFNQAQILMSDQFGIPADAKEAICFAVLANETICGNPANIPTVTGARRKQILGSITIV